VNTLSRKEEFIQALLHEMEMSKEYLQGEIIETIYLGGGTPSLLEQQDIDRIFNTLAKFHTLDLKECTIEVNPDDLSTEKLNILKSFPINRLSIGVQSFFNEDLAFMHRAHNANEAEQCIVKAQSMGFENITIDLIYGTPGLSIEGWEENLMKANALGVKTSFVLCAYR
jgi:oxygen-independent coproporphyrinogen-3 oxidase